MKIAVTLLLLGMSQTWGTVAFADDWSEAESSDDRSADDESYEREGWDCPDNDPNCGPPVLPLPWWAVAGAKPPNPYAQCLAEDSLEDCYYCCVTQPVGDATRCQDSCDLEIDFDDFWTGRPGITPSRSIKGWSAGRIWDLIFDEIL